MVEESPGTGKGNSYGENRPWYLVPPINTNEIMAIWYSIQNLLEVVIPVWGQVKSHVDRLYCTPQEDLAG